MARARGRASPHRREPRGIEGSYRKIESAAEARDRAAYVTSALEYKLLCYEAASVRAILDRSLEYVATRPVVLQRSRETDA